MSDTISTPSSRRGWLALLQWSAVGAAAAVIVACGGGGVGAGGTGITANYSSGTVTGFGSVIVNGVHYDLSSSTDVRGDDDAAGPTDDSNRGVKIGMEVEIESSSVSCSTSNGDTTCRAGANAISWGTELKGPVSAVTLASGAATGNTLTVLGQSVILSSATLFSSQVGSVTNKDAIAIGALVEVHGRLNKATGEINATLIEVKSSLDNYRLSGTLASLNSGARTATVAGQLVEFISSAGVLSGFANGQRVRIRIIPTAVPTTVGSWVVERIRAAGSDLRTQSGREGEIKGVVTDLPSIDGSTASVTFSVDGKSVRVIKANVSITVWNVVAGLTNNSSLVEIEGSIDSTGVLVGRKVELEDDGLLEVELTGPLAAFDSNLKTLTIGGVNGKTFVFSAGGIQFKDGGSTTILAASQLLALSRFGVGVRVEAKGEVQADGTIKLTRFKFELPG